MVPTIVDKLAFVDLIIMNGLKKIAKMWRNSPQVICLFHLLLLLLHCHIVKIINCGWWGEELHFGLSSRSVLLLVHVLRNRF